MKWLEIIKLRSVDYFPTLHEELLPQIDNINQIGLVKIKSYQHALLENDICVLLQWDTGQLEKNGSNLGIHLAKTFMEFGFIDHTIWTGEEM